MEVLRISGGHRFRLKHGPSGDIIALKAPHLIAFSCRGLNFLKPKVLVSEGEQVSLGQPLVAHKHDLRVKLCSPASGRVHEVRFGPRRSLEAIVVAVDAEAEKNVVAQKKYSLNEITGLEKSTVENILLLAGPSWNAHQEKISLLSPVKIIPSAPYTLTSCAPKRIGPIRRSPLPAIVLSLALVLRR
jgi:Na+-transporting NADH:ubiquinone oxidoreductase subunit NqrA